MRNAVERDDVHALTPSRGPRQILSESALQEGLKHTRTKVRDQACARAVVAHMFERAGARLCSTTRESYAERVLRMSQESGPYVGVRVVGRMVVSGDDVLGVVALRRIEKKMLVPLTEYDGVLYDPSDDSFQPTCYARELRHPSTRKKVICDGQHSDHTRVLGPFINSPSLRVDENQTPLKTNVSAPKTVGRCHTALRRIKRGEELLVGYGAQSSRFRGAAVEWFACAV